jgi:hypothetical protein
LFSIDHKSAVHAGGTKFYGIIVISNGDKSALVTHWGKYPGKVPTPLDSQDIQVTVYGTDLGADRSASDKKHEKNKRGYNTWKTRSERMADEVELANWLMLNLTKDAANELATHFSIDPKAKRAAKPAPEPKTAPPSREPAIAKPEGWGSW